MRSFYKITGLSLALSIILCGCIPSFKNDFDNSSFLGLDDNSKSLVQDESNSLNSQENDTASNNLTVPSFDEDSKDCGVSSNDSSNAAITQNIEYKFSSTSLTAVSNVDPSIAEAIDSPHVFETGETEEGWYVVLTEISVTNLLEKPQLVVLNSVSLAQADSISKPIMGSTMSMRYYKEGDASGKDYFKLTLDSNETIRCEVGFLVCKENFEYSEEFGSEPFFYVNPDGVYPANDNARFIPVDLTYE